MSSHRVIIGQPPSKSNQYRIAGNRLYKSKEVKQYEQDFAKQWVNQGRIKGFFELRVIAHMRNHRADLDGIFKVILDNLEKVGAIENDCFCVKIIAEKRVDTNNPRIELTIKEH